MRKMLLLLSLLLCLLSTRGHSQEKPILILNGMLINGRGGKVLTGQDILIQGGNIVRIQKRIKAPQGARIIDARGKTIIPGLIDMHGHLYAFGKTQRGAFPLLYLAAGVTTLFSPGEFEPEKILSLKKAIQEGKQAGPDILFAGPYFDTKESSLAWTAGLADTAAVIKQFEQWKDNIDGLKVYANISKQQFDLIMRKAKQHQLPVTGHLGTLSTRYAVEQGIHGLEHGLLAIRDFGSNPNDYMNHLCHMAQLDLTRPQVSSLIKLIVERKVYVDPTLTAFESLSANFKPLAVTIDDYLDGQAQREVKNRQAYTASYFKDSCLSKAIEKQVAYTRLIYLQGGLLVTGTDPVTPVMLPGFSMKREIEILVQKVGIPLVEAIGMASYNGAIALGLDKTRGSIEVGKAADLSIIEGDLRQDLTRLNQTYLVIKRGQVYNPMELLEAAKGKISVGEWGKRE